MSLEENNKPKYSDLKLDIKVPDVSEYEDEDIILPEDDEDLQRTDEWHRLRCGKWTASQAKNIMGCSGSGGRMDWNNPRKVFEFSKTALKYIYANAKSRQRGYYIETESTKAMKFGTIVEDFMFKIGIEVLGLNLKKVGFITLKDYPTAGVSSDFTVEDENGKIIANGEQKACLSWESHFDRCFDLMDEKGIDFWQVQFQMLAHEVNKTYYLVGEPPRNPNKYLYADNLPELYEDFKKDVQVSVQFVEASPIHQRALLARIIIAEKTVQRWLEEGGNIKTILYEEIDAAKNESVQEDVIIVKHEIATTASESDKEIIYKESENVLETPQLARQKFVDFELVSVEEEEDFNLEQPKEVDLNNVYIPDDLPF